MVGIRMIQKTRKRKYQLIPELGTTSRLTVPGPHSHPSTPKLRPKRCVEKSGDPWDISLPPGSSLQAYGTPPTANGWYLHLALLSGNNHCRSVTFPMRIEPRGHDKAGIIPGIKPQKQQEMLQYVTNAPESPLCATHLLIMLYLSVVFR